MNAMTWWDHQTESIWSQPWGRAIDGPLKGTELELLPSELVPWRTWREAHPDTMALKAGRPLFGRKTFQPNYVIGVTLGDGAIAFPYELAKEAGIVNDAVGPYPIVVHVDPADHGVHVYLRQTGDQVLTFVLQGDGVLDRETGSTWNMDRGLAEDGPFQGQALRIVPYIPAFPEAWRDFYPESSWYDGKSRKVFQWPELYFGPHWH